jgi:hypothetical protein
MKSNFPWKEVLFRVEFRFCNIKPRLNFTSTSCSTRQATQISQVHPAALARPLKFHKYILQHSPGHPNFTSTSCSTRQATQTTQISQVHPAALARPLKYHKYILQHSPGHPNFKSTSCSTRHATQISQVHLASLARPPRPPKFHKYILQHSPGHPNSRNIPHSPFIFDLSYSVLGVAVLRSASHCCSCFRRKLLVPFLQAQPTFHCASVNLNC